MCTNHSNKKRKGETKKQNTQFQRLETSSQYIKIAFKKVSEDNSDFK